MTKMKNNKKSCSPQRLVPGKKRKVAACFSKYTDNDEVAIQEFEVHLLALLLS